MIAAVLSLVVSPAGAKPRAKKKSMFPDLPVQSKAERAAGLWQAGTFATSKGDYDLAVRQFEGCLKADPKSADCKSALKDAKYNLKMNPVAHKKRKPKKAAATAAPGQADSAKAAEAGAAAPAPAGAPQGGTQ